MYYLNGIPFPLEILKFINCKRNRGHPSPKRNGFVLFNSIMAVSRDEDEKHGV